VTAAIELDGLVKRYGDRAVVDGVSLQVAAGEIVALLGPNGAGKTTTVEIIEGYRRADAGEARVLGIDPSAGGRDMRARPRETLRHYAAFHADPRDPDELLDLVGLRGVATTRYRRLSGGERQRLGLALALVGRPEVVVLDEPTAGMDPEGRAATRRIVTDLRGGGVAILLTSHDLADVERLADRIAILVEGRIVAAGTPAELAGGLHPRLRLRFERQLTPAQLGALGAAATATGAATTGATIVVEDDWYAVAGVPPTPALTAAITAWAAGEGILVVESRSVGGSLEDAYLALVGDAGRAS
jgi:ABC-2 type transport system ATP-binding protein